MPRFRFFRRRTGAASSAGVEARFRRRDWLDKATQARAIPCQYYGAIGARISFSISQRARGQRAIADIMLTLISHFRRYRMGWRWQTIRHFHLIGRYTT